MAERVDLREFVGGFVAEAEELIATANGALSDIDAGQREGSVRAKSVRELFRVLHTLKGLAGMIGVEPIVDIAHALETLVRNAESSGGRMRRAATDACVQGIKAIADRVRALADNRPVPAPPERLLDAVALADATHEAAAEPPPLAAEWDQRLSMSERQQLFQVLRSGRHVWWTTFVPSDEKAAKGTTISTVRAKLGELGEILKVVPRTLSRDAAPAGIGFDLLVTSETEPARIAEAAAVDVTELRKIEPPAAMPTEPLEPEDTDIAATTARSVVRVDLDRLDSLQEQLGALIVSRFRLDRELAAHAAAGVDVRRLREIADLQARQLRDLRRGILRARMVRVAEVLEPLALLVRSLVRPGHKEVRLELVARDSELDKAVGDRLLPAIVHLVRNAVDHAIETVDEREAAGKPRAGTIRVECAEVGGAQLELSISDDGRGIDRAAVGRRAGRNVDRDDDLLEVLTTPGFSTRDTATRTSGRGLGMDIVRRITVSDLGGTLTLATAPGAGTTFRLRVPLTIAIIDVLSFTCGAQTFVAPLAAVEEIVELEAERIQPPAIGAGRVKLSMLDRRGKVMPLVSLGALLDVDAGAAARKALIIHHNGEPFAFAVDRMLGRQEVIVRTIDDPLVDVRGVTGSTDLGDGKPTLVLDLHDLGATLVRERTAG
jgi:two-component system chemotaxis sensor kinase CheA